MRRQTALIAAMALVMVLPACGKKKPLAPPPPPAAPATPPPAPPPPTPEPPPPPSEYDRILAMDTAAIDKLGLVQDIHYDFDKSDIREADRQILAKNAEALKKFDFLKITVEGHADERGTAEYNLALGERRAKAAFDYLASLGVSADRMKTVSYGKEIPLCSEHAESCWAQNRRGHFAVTGKTKTR